jgi:hypothetical protein
VDNEPLSGNLIVPLGIPIQQQPEKRLTPFQMARAHAKISTSASVLAAIFGAQEIDIDLTPNPVFVN